MQHTLLSVTDFVARRDYFINQMPSNSIALISAASEVTRSNDTEYPFCQNKNFYYLTGFNEPDAVLVLIKGDEVDTDRNAILFCREKDPLQEVWHGRRVGPQKALLDYGFDKSFVLNELNQLIPQYLNDKSHLLFCHGDVSGFDKKIFAWLETVKSGHRQGSKAPNTMVDCTSLFHEMRLIKTESELNVMRQVNIISGNAHQRAMRKSAIGKFEYQIEAEILYEFAKNGARSPAYNTIVAGGDNANILHYTDNNQVLNNGELLLIDAGGELAGYAADITRTFPVNGQFTDAQKIIYQLVLDVQTLAINAIKPNANFAQLNTLTCDFLTTELHKLNILKGDLPELIEEKACKKYFIHGLGHWLGLDVHDVGDYQVNNKRQQLRNFEPGMVMTIEPGLYIPLSDTDVDEKWRGIGVRIEDNVLVTDQGHENLTVNAPKSIAEIENLMAKHQ
ncbi:MAG: Xaa-Pro aminopeptidase [Alteromonadaceae bacterium]|jgi:Xaa-Pro aminopeptidase|tara:strand:- start:4969 stop:6315 length:1347 start_codon:yes stop_codon:yes gene_type:complete